MAALTANLNHEWKEKRTVEIKMAAVKIYKGALVGMAAETTAGIPDTGYVTNLIVGNTNAYIFCGVAAEYKDNSAGSAGAETIRVYRTGRFQFSKTTAVQADLFQLWGVSDNQTVAALATKAACVGMAVALPDSSHLEIEIDSVTGLAQKSNPSTLGDSF